MKKIIHTPAAPAAIGPYNQAILSNDTLYMSGQIALDPQSGELVDGSIEEETHLVLKNMGAVLAEAGMTYENVVKCTIFMRTMDDYAAVNGVYSEYFSERSPAREAVAVAGLPKDVKVEISAIAVTL
jgi:2-iminobutanoate/2-iminopropanoate deaminase